MDLQWKATVPSRLCPENCCLQVGKLVMPVLEQDLYFDYLEGLESFRTRCATLMARKKENVEGIVSLKRKILEPALEWSDEVKIYLNSSDGEILLKRLDVALRRPADLSFSEVLLFWASDYTPVCIHAVPMCLKCKSV